MGLEVKVSGLFFDSAEYIDVYVHVLTDHEEYRWMLYKCIPDHSLQDGGFQWARTPHAAWDDIGIGTEHIPDAMLTALMSKGVEVARLLDLNPLVVLAHCQTLLET